MYAIEGAEVFRSWNIFTTIVLLNILISLFSSAYEDVTDDAAAHFLAFFAGKTISMIRAPDQFVYPYVHPGYLADRGRTEGRRYLLLAPRST